MTVHSAGVLLHRAVHGEHEIFLVHPGGPYWAKKDEGAWSIPKGIVNPGEDVLTAARREFTEETGFNADGDFQRLGEFRLPGGKHLTVWALRGDCDPAKLASTSFSMIWPPKSGTVQTFPEVDRGFWFRHGEALSKIVRGQRPVVESFFRQYSAGRHG